MKRICLRGLNGKIKGQVWEANGLARVGRMQTLEVVLEDSSVSRCHAELRATDRGWRLTDLGSTNGTRLNGIRLGAGQWPVRARDLIQFGEVALTVDTLTEDSAPEPPPEEDNLQVEATSLFSLDEAMESLVFDGQRGLRPGEQLMAVLRASQHLAKHESEEDLLKSILNDAVDVLDAQRGAIVLADGPEPGLRVRALATGRGDPHVLVNGRAEFAGRPGFSHSLAQRCFQRGESILCLSAKEDPELALAQSISEGSMASVLCVLLRTPRRKLGVLHLDRGPFQPAFTRDDLHVADALAASVSAGIESAQLLRKQRDLFLNTITILAQAVEMRDEYTGGHTARVTTYSLLLARHLDLAPADLELIRIGTPLHDIGKIGIDDAILRKPDRLTPQEFEIMKTHTVKGAEILETLADLHAVIPIVRSHHERWDGKGYPDGLQGDAISPLARVVAVADAFDAMTSDRPYRKGMPAEVAFAEVEKQLGKQFAPDCARGFLEIRDAVVGEMRHTSATDVLNQAGAPACA